LSEPRFRPLFTAEFETTPQPVGEVPQGYFRQSGIIQSGRFHGERLNGIAQPGGGDWWFRRPDGVIHLDVRAMLETDQGEIIYMTYTGRLRGPNDMIERMQAGETIAPDELYFRTAAQFETAAPQLVWLNDVIAFGIGHRRPQGPVYELFELL